MTLVQQRYGPLPLRFNVACRVRCIVACTLAWATALYVVTPGAAMAADRPVVVAFGDSLTAGHGVATDASFPVRLAAALARRGVEARVVNAGVSGDTTAGGQARVDWMLTDGPDLVIVELGANDGLRGLDPAVTYSNLDAILNRLAAHGVTVLLTGMRAPPNLGTEYGDAFNAIFPRLASVHDVIFYPFFLDGVAAQPALNQSDGIHPNAAGIEVIVTRILPYVVEALEKAGAS